LKKLGGGAVLPLGLSRAPAGPDPAKTPAPAEGITVLAGASAPVELATLFAFDDVSIPYWQNLYLRMFATRKHQGNPVLRRGESGRPDEFRAQFYGSIIRHEGKYKMWYIAGDQDAIRELRKRSFLGWRPAYAESDDGIHWRKPNLGLVDYGGNRNNNLLRLDPPELMGMHLVVLHEPEDPDPVRRFKMLLLTRSARGDTSVPLYSADGLRWQAAIELNMTSNVFPSEGFVLPHEFFEQAGLYRWRGTYFVPGQQGSPSVWLPNGEPCGRVMSIFRSRDFRHWSQTKTVAFIRDQARALPRNRGKQAHEGASVWHRGNVLLGLFGLFNGSPDDDGTKREGHPMDLGLLISNDGIHFREPMPDYVLIPSGPAGTWDSKGLISGQGFENLDGETRIWYGGLDGDITAFEVRAEVGLVTLREDGFGALSVKDAAAPASFITCLLRTPTGATLSVNADGLSEASHLKIELLNEAEEPIPEYSGDEAPPLRERGLRTRVVWKGKKRIAPRKDPFRIRVGFDGAQRGEIKLYALYLES
jgi:hypothetical protein